MSQTTLDRPDVERYVAAVGAELADLPADERDDLLADVEASLLAAGEPPRTAPADFAAELREAAGLAPTAAPTSRSVSLLDAARSWLASERVRTLAATGRELAPLWWVARAYVAVAFVALAAGWGWPIGSGTRSLTAGVGTSLLVLVAGTALSLWLGLRGRRGRDPYPRLRLALNLALAVALVPIAAHSLERLSERTASPPEVLYQARTSGLAYDGAPIRNVYPYSRGGQLLHDVLLYDENGRPLAIASGPDDVDRRVPTTPTGDPVLNAFPIRYFEPGTRRVARPDLAPRVNVPDIVTPELERSPR